MSNYNIYHQQVKKWNYDIRPVDCNEKMEISTISGQNSGYSEKETMQHLHSVLGEKLDIVNRKDKQSDLNHPFLQIYPEEHLSPNEFIIRLPKEFRKSLEKERPKIWSYLLSQEKDHAFLISLLQMYIYDTQTYKSLTNKCNKELLIKNLIEAL